MIEEVVVNGKRKVCPKLGYNNELMDHYMHPYLYGDFSIDEQYEKIHEWLKSKPGYHRENYKSHGFCYNCIPRSSRDCPIGFATLGFESSSEYEQYEEEFWGHKEEHCQNPPYCCLHMRPGHFENIRCKRYCYNCQIFGHTMQFCRKIKNCVLCGKKGHNPHFCWKYSTMISWLKRTKELKLCSECLFPCVEGESCCRHCKTVYVYILSDPPHIDNKETQTEDDESIDQEIHVERQNAETIMEKQKQQIQDLEDRLQQQVSITENLNAQLQATILEKEQALQKLKETKLKFDSMEVQLVDARATIENLNAEINQRDLQEEQRQQKFAQSLLITPNNITQAAASAISIQEEPVKPLTPNWPCLTQPVACSNLECSDLRSVKESLLSLQAQQEKTSMIVTQLCNSIKIQTHDNINYLNEPSFSYNPYMGLLDTGQNYTKLR